MNMMGLILGAASFLIIGIFHPIVIKAEYYFGKRCWPAFLIFGILLIALSMLTKNSYASAVFGVIGFSSLWSIHELFEQEQRVKRGWFPKNENRKS